MRVVLLLVVLGLACSGKKDQKDQEAAKKLDIVTLGPQPDGTIVLASRQNFVATILADDRALYWSTLGGAEKVAGADVEPAGVYRLDRDGPPVRLADAGGTPWLAQDADALYLGAPDTGTITRVPKAGRPAKILARDLENLGGLAVDATSLYYLAGAVVDVTPVAADGGLPRGTLDVSRGSSIWRLAMRSGEPPAAIASDLGLAMQLTLDGGWLYTGLPFEGTITRVPEGGGAAELVITDPRLSPPWSIAGGVPYYVRRRPGGGELVRITAGQPAVVFASPSPPAVFTVAGDTIYVATDDGAIHAVTPTGTTVIARRNLPPASMVVHDHRLVIAEVTRVIAIPL